MHDEDGWKHGFTNRVALVVALIRKLTEYKYALCTRCTDHRSIMSHMWDRHFGSLAVCEEYLLYTRPRASGVCGSLGLGSR